MYDITIIGAGITGLALLLLLQTSKADMQRVAIIDPYFDGGDLCRLWGSVQSNTPWSKTAEAVLSACPGVSFPSPPNGISGNQTTPLWQLCTAFRKLVLAMNGSAPYKIQGLATQANWSSQENAWTTTVQSGGKSIQVLSRVLILAQGGDPKGLNLPISSIPLSIALTGGTALQSYVTPGQRIMVFGTAHSGTLVMRNLVRDCSASVVGLYNTDQPFYWDREGAYDGIKAEAADIADAIVAGRLSGIQLVSIKDSSALIRAAAEADWVVYAMGFQPRNGITIQVDGAEKSLHTYDGNTGALKEAPAAWGFGIAYPNRAPDGIHWDVSVAAFLAHMKPQVAAILATAAAMQK